MGTTSSSAPEPPWFSPTTRGSGAQASPTDTLASQELPTIRKGHPSRLWLAHLWRLAPEEGVVLVVLHPVGLFVAVAGAGQRQGQHLAVDRQSPVAGLRDGIQAFAGRDVNEVGAGPCPRRQSHHLLEG